MKAADRRGRRPQGQRPPARARPVVAGANEPQTDGVDDQASKVGRGRLPRDLAGEAFMTALYRAPALTQVTPRARDAARPEIRRNGHAFALTQNEPRPVACGGGKPSQRPGRAGCIGAADPVRDPWRAADPGTGPRSLRPPTPDGEAGGVLLHFRESLEIVSDDSQQSIRCRWCNYLLCLLCYCAAGENLQALSA